MTTGHNVLILFPTDVPAGPSTTLYVGRVVVTVDSDGVFAVTDTNGTSDEEITALVGASFDSRKNRAPAGRHLAEKTPPTGTDFTDTVF